MSENKRSITIAVMLLVIVAFGAQCAFAAPASGKKLIYYGWAMPNTTYVRDHWQEMEQAPLDGTAFDVAIDQSKPTSGDGRTANLLGWHLFGPVAFTQATIDPALADLRVPEWRRFDSNFIAACIVSQDQDHGFNWFDDARWAVILNNWRLYVQLAKEGGCKGIIIDPEQYGGYFLNYQQMQPRSNVTFAEMCQQVRKRGRELMQAAATIFPDMEVPIFFMPSYVWYTQTYNPKPLEQEHYSLLPSFVDGMLEGADARTRFIDFSELAYGSFQRQEFLDWYHMAINKALEYTSLPDLYRARVSGGLPIWIDCPYNGKSWDVFNFSNNYYTPETLKSTLEAALDVTDKYVWFYTEHNLSFFPVANIPAAYMDAIREAHPTQPGDWQAEDPILLVAQGEGSGLPTDKILKYSLDGTYLGEFATGINEVAALIQAPTGDIYVTEYSGGKVKRYDVSGNLLGSIHFVLGGGGGGPTGLAWLNGLLYVNSNVDMKVVSFNPDLTPAANTHNWGAIGDAYASTLSVGPDGKLYCGLYGRTGPGKFVAWAPGEATQSDYVFFPIGKHPATGVWYGGVLYSSEYGGTVYKSEGAGQLQPLVGSTNPYGMTVYDGKIYVSCWHGISPGVVEVYTLNGTFVSSFATVPYARAIAVVDLDPSNEPGTLSGHVTLENLAPGSIPVAVKIELMKNGAVARTAEVALNADGDYSLTAVEAGTYDVAFKAVSYLRKVERGITVPSAGTAACDTSLTIGDIDNDNQVTTTDVNITLNNIDQ